MPRFPAQLPSLPPAAPALPILRPLPRPRPLLLDGDAALEEAVPPPSRHGESNPDPWWLNCRQGGASRQV